MCRGPGPGLTTCGPWAVPHAHDKILAWSPRGMPDRTYTPTRYRSGGHKAVFQCGSKKCAVTKISVLAYTPMWYRKGGPQDEKLSFKSYLRIFVLYSYSQPPNACVPLSGCSRKIVYRVYSYLNTVCSSPEEHRGKLLHFNRRKTCNSHGHARAHAHLG